MTTVIHSAHTGHLSGVSTVLSTMETMAQYLKPSKIKIRKNYKANLKAKLQFFSLPRSQELFSWNYWCRNLCISYRQTPIFCYLNDLQNSEKRSQWPRAAALMNHDDINAYFADWWKILQTSYQHYGNLANHNQNQTHTIPIKSTWWGKGYNPYLHSDSLPLLN